MYQTFQSQAMVFEGPLPACEGPKLYHTCSHYRIFLFAYCGNPNFAPNVFITSFPYPDRLEEQSCSIRSLARVIPSIIIQDRAPSSIKKYVSSFLPWRKWTEARDINVLPTSGPEFSLYLVHLLQTTTSLAPIQAAAFGAAWAHQKACLLSPVQHTMVKQLLEACKCILGTGPKNRKTPLTAAQIKEVVLRFGQGNPSELQIACLIALGFTAFLRWDDLSNLK